MDSSKCKFVCERDENDKKFQCQLVSCNEIPGNITNNNTNNTNNIPDVMRATPSDEVSAPDNKSEINYMYISIIACLVVIFLLYSHFMNK